MDMIAGNLVVYVCSAAPLHLQLDKLHIIQDDIESFIETSPCCKWSTIR